MDIDLFPFSIAFVTIHLVSVAVQLHLISINPVQRCDGSQKLDSVVNESPPPQIISRRVSSQGVAACKPSTKRVGRLPPTNRNRPRHTNPGPVISTVHGAVTKKRKTYPSLPEIVASHFTSISKSASYPYGRKPQTGPTYCSAYGRRVYPSWKAVDHEISKLLSRRTRS
jgi:hypothetical protein